MKNCKSCGSEISKLAKICPHCGRSNYNPIFGIIFVIFLISVGISIVFSDKTKENHNKKYEIIEKAHIIEEGNEHFKTKYIVGSLKNNSKKKATFVRIIFNLYDKEGNIVATSMDSISYLDVDGTWKFKAIVTEKEFSTFKLQNIYGF